jgi:hypothetical protein
MPSRAALKLLRRRFGLRAIEIKQDGQAMTDAPPATALKTHAIGRL